MKRHYISFLVTIVLILGGLLVGNVVLGSISAVDSCYDSCERQSNACYSSCTTPICRDNCSFGPWGFHACLDFCDLAY